MNDSLKRTPLFNEHVRLGAKMVPFAGWEMPVKYAGVIEEHVAVRSNAGLFDVSHMGEVFVSGPEAEKALSYLCCNDVSKLVDGKAQYTAITNDDGGLVDDIIIYRMKEQEYLICVNAANKDKDFAWFIKHNKFDAEFVDVSHKFGQIAIQGPKAISIFEKVLGEKIINFLPSFSHITKRITTQKGEAQVIVARTGYTGEDGVEIFTPWDLTEAVWCEILKVGEGQGLVPCGLGARDTLRLEACLPLYGHELGEEFSAIESGIGFFVKISERDFKGKKTIQAHKENGSPRSLVGFFVEEPGIVRDGTKVFNSEGIEVGLVTSGTKTPSFEKPLGLAIIKSEFAKVDTEILADVRGKKIKCKIARKPFYKRSLGS